MHVIGLLIAACYSFLGKWGPERGEGPGNEDRVGGRARLIQWNAAKIHIRRRDAGACNIASVQRSFADK